MVPKGAWDAPSEQTSAPKLSPFCWVRNAAAFLVFMLKVIERAGDQSNHPGRGRHKFQSSSGWMNWDWLPSCQGNTQTQGSHKISFHLSWWLCPPSCEGTFEEPENKWTKRRLCSPLMRVENTERNPDFKVWFLRCLSGFTLNYSKWNSRWNAGKSQISSSVSRARDAASMVSEIPGTRGQNGQAWEQWGLTRDGRSSWNKQAVTGSSDHSCLQKLLLE